MRRILLVVLCSVGTMVCAYAQSVKTQMQTQNVSIGAFNASLTYPYYEDDNGNYVKHGVANISSNSTYRDNDGTQIYKMSGSATFAHGKLDGTFYIKYTMSGHVWDRSRRIWTDGSKTLSIKGGFKNGLPNGHWTGEGTYNGFLGYKQDFPDKIDVTYKDGILVGTFDYIYINNNGGLFEGKGKADADGYYDGKCTLLGCGIEGEDNTKIELTCKNQWLVLQVLRSTSGEIKERYEFGETRQKAIDSLVSGVVTEQEVLERYGFVSADQQYTYCWNSRGAEPEGFLYSNFPTEFQKLTGLSVEDIKFDGGKYRFLRDEKWIRLNQNIVDSILLNSSITANSYEFNPRLSEYSKDYPNIYYFYFDNKKYMVPEQSLSLYDSLKIKYNAKVAEKKEEYKIAQQKKDLEDFKNSIRNRMRSRYSYLDLIPNAVSRQSGELTDYKIIEATLSDGNPIVAVEFEWHCLVEDIYRYYRLYLKKDKEYYREVIDSCILFEPEITKTVRNLVHKAQENNTIIAKYAQEKAYKDIISLYTSRSNEYDLTPNYAASVKAQTDYLPIITRIVQEQDAFIRFLKLREQLANNHTEIMSAAKPYKHIMKAYSSLYKSFVLSYNQTVADETRLKEYVCLQEKLISLVSKDASQVNMGIKGIKDPVEIRKYIEKI